MTVYLSVCVCQESVGGKCSICTFTLFDPCNKLTVFASVGDTQVHFTNKKRE